jgi:hypothetical protein
LGPAVIGVYQNNQGTPQSIDDFTAVLTKFQNAKASMGWPRFYKIYTNIPTNPPPSVLLKFPSPLEVFARLGGANPPPDLYPLLTQDQWNKNELWTPIAALRSNWTAYAGTVAAISNPPYYTTTSGFCGKIPTPGAPVNNWCDAIVAVKGILLRNYTNYRTIFSNQCKGVPADISDNLLISHAYGRMEPTFQTDIQSSPHPTGVAMFGINPDRRSHAPLLPLSLSEDGWRSGVHAPVPELMKPWQSQSSPPHPPLRGPHPASSCPALRQRFVLPDHNADFTQRQARTSTLAKDI